MTEKITSTDIRAAILKTFSPQEWAILFEVPAGTGAVRNNRSADVIMMSLWPSRGLDLHGIEIKVSRSDWKNEAKDPSKAERIATYCDFWWVYVGPGVIHDLADVPTNWGVREFDGKRLKTIKEAARLQPSAIDRPFLAALLRRTSEANSRDISAEVRKAVDEIRANDERRIASEIESRTRQAKEIVEREKAFAEASGLDLRQLTYRHDIKEVAALLKLLLETGVKGQYQQLEYLHRQMTNLTSGLRKALDEYTAATSEPAEAAE